MKPSQQQRGTGLSSDKRSRPKLGAGASFGNAGIEPSKNKARLASSQMHVFREAPTQEQVSKPEMAKATQLKLNTKPVPKALPLRQNMKPKPKPVASSASSQIMSSFLNKDAPYPKKAIVSNHQGEYGTLGKRGRESGLDSSNLTKKQLARPLDIRAKSNSILSMPRDVIVEIPAPPSYVNIPKPVCFSTINDGQVRQHPPSDENYPNRLDDFVVIPQNSEGNLQEQLPTPLEVPLGQEQGGDSSSDEDIDDLIGDNEFREHQVRHKKQQQQLLLLQTQQQQQDEDRESLNMAEESNQEIEELDRGRSIRMPIDSEPDDEAGVGDTEQATSSTPNGPAEDVVKDEKLDKTDIKEEPHTKIGGARNRTVTEFFEKVRTSQVRPRQPFVRDPRHYGRFPLPQKSMDRLPLKRLSMDNSSSDSMPRRVEYCDNAEVGARAGVNRIVFDTYGEMYAVCGSNGVVRIHDFETSENNILQQRSPLAEIGSDIDCLRCSVNCKRSVSDLAWSSRKGNYIIAVAFQTHKEIWLYDLNNLSARSEPNLRIPTQTGNRSVQIDCYSDDEDTIIVGSSTGGIRMFTIPVVEGHALRSSRLGKCWEVHGDPQRKTEKAAVVGLLYPSPGVASSSRAQKSYRSIPHEGVLVSVTEHGAIVLWDTKNLAVGNFGTSAQPRVLAQINTKEALGGGRQLVVGVECVDISVGRTGFDEESWQPAQFCSCVIAITFSTGSVYCYDLTYQTAALRGENLAQQKEAEMFLRKNQSHCTSGRAPHQHLPQQKQKQKRKGMPSIESAGKRYGDFVAKSKFDPPAKNIGAKVTEEGGMLREITEEGIVAEQILRNNKFNTPPCVTRWTNNRLHVFSSFPHFHPDLGKPTFYITVHEALPRQPKRRERPTFRPGKVACPLAEIALPRAPATAMAAHPYLPYILVGDRDDNVRVLSSALVSDHVPDLGSEDDIMTVNE